MLRLVKTVKVSDGLLWYNKFLMISAYVSGNWQRQRFPNTLWSWHWQKNNEKQQYLYEHQLIRQACIWIVSSECKRFEPQSSKRLQWSFQYYGILQYEQLDTIFGRITEEIYVGELLLVSFCCFSVSNKSSTSISSDKTASARYVFQLIRKWKCLCK